MRPDTAISELESLKEEGESGNLAATGGATFTSWRSRVKSIFVRSLGNGHHIVEQFDSIRYGLGMWTDRTPASAWTSARQGGINSVLGLIDAAMYELALLRGDDEPIDQRSFDPDLWEFVKSTVESEDWKKVASQVSTFVEHCFRTWSGRPKDKNGDDAYGRGLFTLVLADDGEYRLGKRKGEWEGWRMLGAGFATAIGNVDRHQIQERSDARRYAIGVLGLGSLLLTQLRHEHESHFIEAISVVDLPENEDSSPK